MQHNSTDEEDQRVEKLVKLKRELELGYEQVMIMRVVDACHFAMVEFLHQTIRRNFDLISWQSIEKIMRDQFKSLEDGLKAITELDRGESPMDPAAIVTDAIAQIPR